MPSTQKALLLTEKFGNFVVDEVPVPKPGPGEVLVKILATSLNPVDWKIQKYGLFREDFPAILGADIAGEVEELGESVTEFKKGDRVFTQAGFSNDQASFQQYATTPTSTLGKIPNNTSFDEASTFSGGLNVVYVAFYNKAPYGLGLEPPISATTQGIYTGTPIIILGGASSVGQNAIQLAKISGFSPIITTASLKHTDHLKSIGATAVLDRNLSTLDLAREVTRITSSLIKIAFDAISSDSTQKTGLDILAPGGQLVIVLPPTIKAEQDKIVIHAVGMPRAPHNLELFEKFYQDVISGFIERGWLKPNNIEVLPNGLAGIPAGIARLEADKISGLKLVAHPQETT